MFFPSSILKKAASKQSNNPSKPKAQAPESQKAKSQRIFAELRAKATPEKREAVKGKVAAMKAKSAPTSTSGMKKAAGMKARGGY